MYMRTDKEFHAVALMPQTTKSVGDLVVFCDGLQVWRSGDHLPFAIVPAQPGMAELVLGDGVCALELKRACPEEALDSLDPEIIISWSHMSGFPLDDMRAYVDAAYARMSLDRLTGARSRSWHAVALPRSEREAVVVYHTKAPMFHAIFEAGASFDTCQRAIYQACLGAHASILELSCDSVSLAIRGGQAVAARVAWPMPDWIHDWSEARSLYGDLARDLVGYETSRRLDLVDIVNTKESTK